MVALHTRQYPQAATAQPATMHLGPTSPTGACSRAHTMRWSAWAFMCLLATSSSSIFASTRSGAKINPARCSRPRERSRDCCESPCVERAQGGGYILDATCRSRPMPSSFCAVTGSWTSCGTQNTRPGESFSWPSRSPFCFVSSILPHAYTTFKSSRRTARPGVMSHCLSPPQPATAATHGPSRVAGGGSVSSAWPS